jgi:hypothetical protein
MRAAPVAIGRLILLVLVLAHWAATPALSPTQGILGSPTLEQADPRAVAISHRALAVISIKQSPVDRPSHAPSADAALVPAIRSVEGGGSFLDVADILDQPISVSARAYDARGPPIA